MKRMNTPLLIVILYILALYGISWYATKLSKKGGLIGFLLANRGLPAAIVAVMVAGLAIGGSSTVGVAESAYTKGLSAGMYNAAWAVGAILTGLIAAAKYRNMNVTTITELFEKYYSNSGRVVGVIGQLIIMMTITSLQYVAGGAILTALLPNVFTFNSGMVVTALVFVGITLIGGYWAAGLSNLINVIVIYIGLVGGAFAVVSNAGGLGNIAANLPAGVPWFSWTDGVGHAMVAAWFVVMITQAFSTQAIAQVSFAAKDSRTAKKGFIIGGLLILPVGFVAALFGIVAAMKYPGLPKAALALPTIVMAQHPVIAGLTLSGLWAADVSTAVGLLLGSSTLILQDIVKPLMKPQWSPTQETNYARLWVLFTAGLTFVLALSVRSILSALTLGLSLTTAFTILLLATIYTPKLCKKSSAVWTLVAGIIILLIWQFVPASHIVPHVIYLEWVVTLAVFLLVAVFDKRQAEIPENFAKDNFSA